MVTYSPMERAVSVASEHSCPHSFCHPDRLPASSHKDHNVSFFIAQTVAMLKPGIKISTSVPFTLSSMILIVTLIPLLTRHQGCSQSPSQTLTSLQSLTIHSAPPSLQNSGITWVAPSVTRSISSWTRSTAHQTNRPCPQMKLIFASSPLPTLCRKTSTRSSYGTTINTRSTKSFSSSAIRRTTIAKRRLQWHTPLTNLAVKSST